MWPVGHLAVAYLSYRSLQRVRGTGPPAAGATLALAVGSQLPDLVDKPLGWYTTVLPAGRSLLHSLTVLVPLGLLAIALAGAVGRPAPAIAATVGALSHTFVDTVPVLWGSGVDPAYLLWPLLPVTPAVTAPSILAMLQGAMTEPWFLAEYLCAALALGVWHHDGHPGSDIVVKPVRRRSHE